MAETRIDISVNESGTKVVLRDIKDMADAAVGLTPTLAASLRGLALRVGVNTDKVVRQVATAALQKVVSATPVDTGAAKANWETTISDGPPSLSPSREKQDPAGRATIAAGMATISSKRTPGQTVYISNGLDYIQYLNEGTSSQAPAGFVEMAVQAATRVASNANLVGE